MITSGFYIIKNIHHLNRNMSGYGVILTDTHPQSVVQDTWQKNGEHFLWYNFQLEIMPWAFYEYLSEKLALVDEVDALNLIYTWNDDLYKSRIEELDFNRIIDIGNLKFGILDIGDPSRVALMMSQQIYDPDTRAGQGGYPWHLIETDKTPDPGDLMEVFDLSETQVDEFMKQW